MVGVATAAAATRCRCLVPTRAGARLRLSASAFVAFAARVGAPVVMVAEEVWCGEVEEGGEWMIGVWESQGESRVGKPGEEYV